MATQARSLMTTQIALDAAKQAAEANERRFLRFVHLEADNDHRPSGTRRRVDVFHARHFPEQLLHGTRDPLFDIRRAPGSVQMMQRNQALLHVGPGAHLLRAAEQNAYLAGAHVAAADDHEIRNGPRDFRVMPRSGRKMSKKTSKNDAGGGGGAIRLDVGTVTGAGGLGGTIWHPFAPAVHPLDVDGGGLDRAVAVQFDSQPFPEPGTVRTGG